MDNNSIRLDKWLWFARVVKTRTLAQKLVQGSNIRINKTKVSKPSVTISIGDVLTISLHERILVYRVLSCGTRRASFSIASLLYEDLTPTMPSNTIRKPANAFPGENDARPDKYNRRKLLALKKSNYYY